MKQSFTKQRITRVSMTLFVMMLATVGTWAAALNGNPTDGYYYNLPESGTITQNLSVENIETCKGVFSVYDNGGVSGHYSPSCDGRLNITAPEGYVFQLSGNIRTEGEKDYLIVNDGPSYLHDKIINQLYGFNVTVPTITTSSNGISICLVTDSYSADASEADGLFLTVKVLKTVELADNDDNTATLTTYNEKLVGSVTLKDRTLSKKNGYNTLTLPFALTAAQIAASPLAGASILALNGETSSFTGGTLTLNFDEVTEIAAGTPYLVGWNTAGPDLEIEDAEGWARFANNVNSGTESYDGKVVKLNADISTSTMVGSMVSSQVQGNPFKGTFDGGGHTITVNIDETSYTGTAPFRYIYGATIMNVKIAGTVRGTNHCAGLVGFAKGNSAIKNCEMAAAVTCTQTHCGGIVGHALSSTTTVTDCLVSGSVMADYSTTSERRVGIIIGWGDYGDHIAINCVSGGSYPMSGPVKMNYGLGNSSTPTVCTNCYLTTSTKWGKDPAIDAASWSAEELQSKLGSGWKIEGGKVVPAMNVEISYDGVVKPVFKNVTIVEALSPVNFTGGSFEGNYAPFTIDDSNKDAIVYLGSNNIIGKATTTPKTLRPFRAHFYLPTSSGSRAVDRIIMNLGDDGNGGATGIIMIPADKSNAIGGEGWYTIDGRSLSGEPTAKGLYINNGRKVVIK